jgi:YbbR domain-containing protein
MKIKDFINKATDNWGVKAACVLLAAFFYIFYTLSMQDSRSFTVPLKIESSGGIAPAGNYPTKVKVTLKGKTEDIATVRESEISAYVDLNYLSKDGTYRLPVLVNLPKSAMLLETLEVKVSPQEISLKVEEQISGFVSISPLVNGKPAHGFEVKSITLKPDTIEITGPRSMVEHCTRVQTKEISVKNAEVSFEKTVDPEIPGAYLKFKNKEKISATVEIVPVGSTKKISNIQVLFTSLAEDFEIYPKNLTVSAELKGNLLELEKYSPLPGAVSVNCSEITSSGEYELPLKVNFPDKFEIAEISAEKVKFEVRKIQKSDDLEEKITVDMSVTPGTEVLPPKNGTETE